MLSLLFALLQVQVGTVSVVASDKDLSLGIALAERAEQPAEWPGLGRRPAPPFRLVLARDEADLQRRSDGRAPAWGAGIAVPGARLVMLRADADPASTLRHELAHLVLHDAVRQRIPLWFDEGYAVYATNAIGALDALALNYAVIRGTTPSLDSLNRTLRGHPAGIGTAYALSATAVMELARRNPTGTLQPLMERLEAGVPFADAVLATTGLTLDRFDEAWVRSIRQRYSLFTWLAASGIWALVAVGVIAGTQWRRRRDRPRRAALNEGWVVAEDEQLEALTSLDQTGDDK